MQVPVLLDVAGQHVLCVGAGPVAARKVAPLLTAGAVVTVVAPQVHPDLAGAADVLRRPYAEGDVDRQPLPRLVVAGTGVAAVDDAVAAAAARRGIWCLRIDGRGDVALPAVLRHDDLVVAVATGAPALSRRLRELLEEVVDERWRAASTHLAALRRDPAVRAALATLTPEERRRRWTRAVDAALDPPTSAEATSAARAELEGQPQARPRLD